MKINILTISFGFCLADRLEEIKLTRQHDHDHIFRQSYPGKCNEIFHKNIEHIMNDEAGVVMGVWKMENIIY